MSTFEKYIENVGTFFAEGKQFNVSLLKLHCAIDKFACCVISPRMDRIALKTNVVVVFFSLPTFLTQNTKLTGQGLVGMSESFNL